MRFLMLTLFLIAGCSSNQKISADNQTQKTVTKPSGNTITISRYFTIKTCYDNKSPCIGPVAKELEKANVTLELAPFTKGADKGVTAIDEYKIQEEGISFSSEIRITQQQGENGYFVYVMLKSGRSKARKGVVKTFFIPKLSELTETRIMDKTIRFQTGTLEAELVVGPKLKM